MGTVVNRALLFGLIENVHLMESDDQQFDSTEAELSLKSFQGAADTASLGFSGEPRVFDPAVGGLVHSHGCGVTFSQFVERTFLPEHLTTKSNSGRRHYQAILKHVLTPLEVDAMFEASQAESRAKLKEDPRWPYLSCIPLVEVNPDHVQRLISAAVEKGYSAQTVKHIRNVVRVIFFHAIKRRCYLQENPAVDVTLPDMKRREPYSLNLSQTEQLFQRMHYPEREIALLAILTNMTIAEICGLQWMFVNLTDHLVTREGVSISPKSIAIRNQLYRGEFAVVPPSRKKEIPISPLLVTVLRYLANSKPAGWHDFVLATKSGRPINQVNLAARRLKRIGMQLGMPWISWQVLRRTRRTIFQEYETRIQEQLSRVILPVWMNRTPVPMSKILNLPGN